MGNTLCTQAGPDLRNQGFTNRRVSDRKFGSGPRGGKYQYPASHQKDGSLYGSMKAP